MYLHLGQDTVVRTEDILGIFDIDRTTVSQKTRAFLSNAEKNGEVVNVSAELPKSFTVCTENGKTRIYISPISPTTLRDRAADIK